MIDPPKQSLDEIGSALCEEIHTHKRWTAKCTTLLTTNLHCLYTYDQYEYCFGRAYDHSLNKILLHPIMVLCYHPSCLSMGKLPVRLKLMFDMSNLLLHLMDQQDPLGFTLQKRFTAE